MGTQRKSIYIFILSAAAIALILWTALSGLNLFGHILPGSLDPSIGIHRGLDIAGGTAVVYAPGDKLNPTADEMNSAVDILKARLDKLGYSDAEITIQGFDLIRVETAELPNPEQTVQELGKTAHLTLRNADGNVIIDGSEISRARYRYSAIEQGSRPVSHVVLEFTDIGKDQFYEATQKAASLASENKNYITIMLDDKTVSTITVDEASKPNNCIISGKFNYKSATALADTINIGTLPFSLRIVDIIKIGPPLGENTLSTAMLALIIGMLLVILFIVFEYRICGLIAILSLMGYSAIVLLIMGGAIVSLTRITLTLPALLGAVLAFGITVNSNILVLERVREELITGKKNAIESGFHSAFTAIIDYNISALIISIVLFYFGNGTAKSFASALAVGIVADMTSVIVITKRMLTLLVGMGSTNNVLMTGRIGETD